MIAAYARKPLTKDAAEFYAFRALHACGETGITVSHSFRETRDGADLYVVRFRADNYASRLMTFEVWTELDSTGAPYLYGEY